MDNSRIRTIAVITLLLEKFGQMFYIYQSTVGFFFYFSLSQKQNLQL